MSTSESKLPDSWREETLWHTKFIPKLIKYMFFKNVYWHYQYKVLIIFKILSNDWLSHAQQASMGTLYKTVFMATWIASMLSKWLPLNGILVVGNKKKLTRTVGWLWQHCHVVLCQDVWLSTLSWLSSQVTVMSFCMQIILFVEFCAEHHHPKMFKSICHRTSLCDLRIRGTLNQWSWQPSMLRADWPWVGCEVEGPLY